MLNHYTLAQVQCTSILLEAALKEYAADWLKNADSVMRDETGKFAKKVASVGQEVSQVKQSVQETIKDPKEARRKVSSELLKLTAKGLDKLVEKNPKFTDELLDKMFGLDAQKARDKLADMYGDINPGLPNAIRPDPLKETLSDVLKNALAHKGNPKQLAKDLIQAFELAGDSYNKLIDDLNNVESESEAIKLLGKIAATSIPIAGYLAATLTPEIAIGLLAGDTLTTILASAAATQAVSFAANKAMDKMDVENPWVRTGIDLAVGIGVGGAVSTGAKQLKQTKAIGQVKAFAQRKLISLHRQIEKEANKYGVKVPKIPLGQLTKDGDFADFPPIFKERPKNISDDIDFDQTPYGAGFKFEIEGNKVLLGIGDDGVVGFKINDKFDMDESLADNVKRRAAVKLTKLFKAVVKEMEEDKVLWCNIHDKDGLEAATRRLKAYTLMGFGEKVENTVYGIVKEGKLVPYKPSLEELNKIHGG
jgi:hypothetical protein